MYCTPDCIPCNIHCLLHATHSTVHYVLHYTVQFCSSEKDSESESGHFTWVMVVFIQNAKIKNLTARLDRSIEGQSESGGEESQENYAIVTR